MAILTNAFEINGVIDTRDSVVSNMNKLCSAAGAWMTFDVNKGMWSVVINRAGSSVKSFNDSNIIGNINISGTGINEYYNSVSVEFPHKDLRDQTDYVDMEIPVADRYPNELDNNLQMTFQCINDPVQAQYLGTVELKQSRIDRVIEFRTDYSSFGLKAGDIIDITASMYGYTNKKFRITKLTEEDSDDGNIQLSITGLEYDESVYDTSGLIRTERNKKTGIVPKSQNTALTKADDAQNLNSMGDAVQNLALANLLLKLMSGLSSNGGAVAIVGAGDSGVQEAPAGTDFVYKTVGSVTLPYTGYYKARYFINWGGSGDPGTNGVLKNSEMKLLLNGVPLTIGPGAYTGDTHVQLYEDHFLEDIFQGTKGQVLTLQYGSLTDWPTAVYLCIWEVMAVPAR